MKYIKQILSYASLVVCAGASGTVGYFGHKYFFKSQAKVDVEEPEATNVPSSSGVVAETA